MASTQGEPPPYDVVPIAQHDDVARRVCIRREWVSQRIFELEKSDLKTAVQQAKPNDQAIRNTLRPLFENAHMLPDVAHYIISELKPPPNDPAGVFDTRQAQAREFLRDWTSWDQARETINPTLVEL